MLLYISAQSMTAPQAMEPPFSSTAEDREDADDGYLIGVEDNRVAVFHAGELMMKTETLVDSLPKSDQNRLREGVRVNSDEELKMLIQDYCS